MGQCLKFYGFFYLEGIPLYSSRGNFGKVLYLRRGLGDLDPKVGKNSNYDYFELKYILIQKKSKITNYSISTKTNIVIT